MNYEQRTHKNKPKQSQFLNLSGTGFKRELVKMSPHEAVKCIDTVLQFTLNLIKSVDSALNNDKAKK